MNKGLADSLLLDESAVEKQQASKQRKHVMRTAQKGLKSTKLCDSCELNKLSHHPLAG